MMQYIHGGFLWCPIMSNCVIKRAAHCPVVNPNKWIQRDAWSQTMGPYVQFTISIETFMPNAHVKLQYAL